MAEQTFFAHETFKKDGKTFRRWQTGKLGDTGYTVHSDGSLRHAAPQFRGSKKDRKRFIAAVRGALQAPLPPNYVELLDTDVLQKEPTLDLVFDVQRGEWRTTPYYGCTVAELRNFALGMVRGARAEIRSPLPLRGTLRD